MLPNDLMIAMKNTTVSRFDIIQLETIILPMRPTKYKQRSPALALPKAKKMPEQGNLKASV
jgi:hypothetical protein